MDQATTAIHSALETLGWADANITELEAMIDRVYESGSESFTEHDPQTDEKVYKIRLRYRLPDRARRLVSEIIMHSRHAMDQALTGVYRASIGEDPKELSKVQFNRRNSPAGQADSFAKKPLCRFGPGVIWALKNLQPYPSGDSIEGGNDVLFDLIEAATRKHHAVCTTKGSVSQVGISNGQFTGVSIIPQAWNASKDEMQIARGSRDSDAQFQHELTLHILLNNAGRLSGREALPTLKAVHFAAECAVYAIHQGHLEDL